ncbi:MAG: Gfo/Idh/MocA family oxidoreductase [Eubacteriales bacterium]|nr:Gfo/Idh/MocA family oxidoreductase [Eubacteriales bacterium]
MLRIGLIGCGRMGRDHVERVTKRVADAEIVAVSDVIKENVDKAVAICGGRAYEDPMELIEAEDVDAVMVVSPGFAHEEQIIHAVELGKPVFTEKPMATTAAACRRIVDAEMKSGKHLVQVGFMRRFDVGYRQMKKAVDSGIYGEPLMLHCTHRNAYVLDDYNTPMAVHDTAIHEIDCLHWLLDDEWSEVQVIMPRQTKNAKGRAAELQDPQLMILRSKKGVCVDLEVFVTCRFGYDINCEVVCEEGSITMPQPAAPIIKHEAKIERELETDFFNRFIDAYDVEIKEWVEATLAGRVDGPSAWDGYMAAMTADALVKAQKSGRIEKVETEETPAFYK